jgi:hypothetical protein
MTIICLFRANLNCSLEMGAGLQILLTGLQKDCPTQPGELYCNADSLVVQSSFLVVVVDRVGNDCNTAVDDNTVVGSTAVVAEPA